MNPLLPRIASKHQDLQAILRAMRSDDQLALLMEADDIVRFDRFTDEKEQAERLLAVGWRPGQSTEDARRLLKRHRKS